MSLLEKRRLFPGPLSITHLMCDIVIFCQPVRYVWLNEYIERERKYPEAGEA
jgi:hypothetical protein